MVIAWFAIWGNKKENPSSRESESLPMSTHESESPPAVTSAIDPVCGRTVDGETAKWRFAHEDREYLFCRKGCLKKFSAAPQLFLSSEAPRAQAEAAAEDRREHICPMNPRIHQIGPGICPKCGTPLKAAKVDSEP